MDIQKFKKCITKRINTDDDDDIGVDKCHQEIADVIAEDMPGMIRYLYDGCTLEEYLWMSECYEDIVVRAPDMGFVDGLRYLARKYPKETKEYSVEFFLNSAQYLIEEIEAQNWPLVKEVVPEASVPSLKEWLRSHGKLKEKEQ